VDFGRRFEPVARNRGEWLQMGLTFKVNEWNQKLAYGEK
jgi:hypothetical protein